MAILEQIGVPTRIVPAPRGLLQGSQQPARLLSLIPALGALPRWADLLSRHEFWRDADVLYTIGFKGHLAAALRRDRPMVWHLHEFPPVMTGLVWKFLAGRTPDAVIANSEAVAEAWRSGNREPGKGRPVVVRNGIDLDRFKPRPRTFWVHDHLGVPREHRLIGMPAVFARWKGQIEVIEAFRQIHSEFRDVHLVLVGGSIYDTVSERDYGAMLRQAVEASREWSTPPSSRFPLPVLLLPFQPKVELVYPELDLVTHYSLRPEPFGRVILEAMACAVPVVAAAEGGPLEILGAAATEGGETPEGWLAVPRQPRALAHTLRRALQTSPDQLRAKGAAGRSRAEEHFSARAFARGVAQVLRSHL